MEIFVTLWVGFLAIMATISDSMSLPLNLVLIFVVALVGCFTVGDLKNYIRSTINTVEDDRMFYGKIRIKSPNINVYVPDNNIHGLIILWTVCFYVLSYSLMRKYELSMAYLDALAIFCMALLSTLIGWFVLNLKYAKEFSSVLNSLFKNRTNTDVKLSTAIRCVLNELEVKLHVEFSEFCSYLPINLNELDMSKQLRDLQKEGSKYINHLGLREDLDLDINNFLSAQKSRIDSFLNEKFKSMWPDYQFRRLAFDVMFVKSIDHTFDESEAMIPTSCIIYPIIVFGNTQYNFRQLYKSLDVSEGNILITEEEANTLNRRLSSLGVHCLVLKNHIEYVEPYTDRPDVLEALSALTENLRTSIMLKPKDHLWLIFNLLTAWPFYVLNVLTRNMLVRVFNKAKKLLNSSLEYISKITVRDL